MIILKVLLIFFNVDLCFSKKKLVEICYIIHKLYFLLTIKKIEIVNRY